MHGNEAAGILRDVLRGVIALADRRALKLELHQLGIQQVEQQIVGPFAVDLRELEILVVKTLLDAGLGGLFGDFVVSVAARFTSSMVGVWDRRGWEPSSVSARRLSPRDPIGQIVAQLLDPEVRAFTTHASIREDLLQLGSLKAASPPKPESAYPTGEQSSIRWIPASARILIVPGKSFAIIVRTGQVWHPIGIPKGLARSLVAWDASSPASATLVPALVKNSLSRLHPCAPAFFVDSLQLPASSFQIDTRGR